MVQAVPTMTGWRVVWGNSRFLRINEFESEELVRSFVGTIAAHDQTGRSIHVRIDRWSGGRWVDAVTTAHIGPRSHARSTRHVPKAGDHRKG